MIKTKCIGGTSDAQDVPYFIEYLKILNPYRILDLGTGCFGKTAYLARMYIEHKYRHIYGISNLYIEGVEAFKDNFYFVKSLDLYDKLWNFTALEYFRKIKIKPFDVVVMSHVIEHHIKKEGWELLRRVWEITKKGIILVAPYGEYKHIDKMNKYQTHRSKWTPQEISKIYPITTPIFTRNNIGKEEFLIVIPKRISNEL